jgi:hypothetical protein
MRPETEAKNRAAKALDRAVDEIIARNTGMNATLTKIRRSGF